MKVYSIRFSESELAQMDALLDALRERMGVQVVVSDAIRFAIASAVADNVPGAQGRFFTADDPLAVRPRKRGRPAKKVPATDKWNNAGGA